ncbi:MAG: hypothetical protein OXF74_05440 [Rhodobacteraceae bacterium]|nr:hypothetical protein [Paracoccaceae bacterium]
MVNLISQHKPVLILGAGAFFIDRYEENGKVRGAETYVGDTVAATIGATTERQTVFSGDGAVATKIIDKVTSVDRTLGITPQDATLDNIALFLIASKPAKISQSSGDIVTEFNIPLGADDRTYFQLGAAATNPAGRPKFAIASDTPIVLASGFESDKQTAGTFAAVTLAAADFELDRINGRIRFMSAGLGKLVGDDPGRAVKCKVTILTGKAGTSPEFQRVAVDAAARQVRVAVRYIEDADEGVEGRNIYIPQASVSPAGEASLKSRDTPQQFPLTLAIEDPGSGLAQIYVDGVPA